MAGEGQAILCEMRRTATVAAASGSMGGRGQCGLLTGSSVVFDESNERESIIAGSCDFGHPLFRQRRWHAASRLGCEMREIAVGKWQRGLRTVGVSQLPLRP